VPLAQLREVTVDLARNLLEKNPVVLRAAKHGFKRCRELTWEQNEDYLYAKLDQSRLLDTEGGREQGMKQFLDDKSIKPGLQAYKR
jgi:trans-feruloyl-CoA hydratase/vanillin synthase